MSGHSKWSTIKRKKGAEDAKRGKMFTRLGRDITVAAREGGGDPNFNPNLRLAIDKAKTANMPKDNIERAIKRGTGELEGGELEEITYEGYAPHGVAMLIQCLTDNRNRTLSEVRRVFNKNGGNLAEQGAVAWMFDLKGYITVSPDKVDPDEVFIIAVESGADDIEISDDIIEIYTPPTELHAIAQALQEAGISVDEAELAQFAQNEIELDVKETLSVMNIIELLEELDDVDKVYANLHISEDALVTLEAA
ncbi:MAG: YebC/PmpR family DNA-binding transcriptional regulator [Phycisphaerae bacterium]|nr:YebC/PmpR family DNA-binding transcriptional regulator [Phycisphaerae bacterium]NIX26065.1 YebC/PmpR family DNA-binding transcriptional regulator [Phycisphaerae bacterium]